MFSLGLSHEINVFYIIFLKGEVGVIFLLENSSYNIILKFHLLSGKCFIKHLTPHTQLIECLKTFVIKTISYWNSKLSKFNKIEIAGSLQYFFSWISVDPKVPCCAIVKGDLPIVLHEVWRRSFVSQKLFLFKTFLVTKAVKIERADANKPLQIVSRWNWWDRHVIWV